MLKLSGCAHESPPFVTPCILARYLRGGCNKNGDKSPKLSSLLKSATESGETITITPFHASRAFRDALRMRAPGRRCRHKKRRRSTPAEQTGGDDGDRTHDLRLAKPALSQLSYVPALVPLDIYNNRPSGDSANAGATIVKISGGPDKVRTCDLPVISRTL